MVDHFASRSFHGLLILRKGRRRDQCPLGSLCKGQPEDEIRRSIATEDPFPLHTVPPRDPLGKHAAQGVWVMNGSLYCGRRRPAHGLRHAQRIQICGKVHDLPLKPRLGGENVAAVGIRFHPLHPPFVLFFHLPSGQAQQQGYPAKKHHGQKSRGIHEPVGAENIRSLHRAHGVSDRGLFH